mgnify:CR=1 FL=1
MYNYAPTAPLYHAKALTHHVNVRRLRLRRPGALWLRAGLEAAEVAIGRSWSCFLPRCVRALVVRHCIMPSCI